MPGQTVSGPHPALRRAALVAFEVALALALVACGASDPPPRSPLDDRGPAPTVPPGVTSFPPPFTPPALTATPGVPTAPSGAPTSPDRGDPEAAAGAAIEVLAQRMAVSATRLSLVSVEPVDWPSACLGAEVPGVACAQVVTPGYRVILRYDTGSRHEVHTGRGGLAVWVPQETLQATVREAELGGAPLVLEAAGRTVRVLLGPGTQRLGGPMGALKGGDRVTLGADDPRDGGPLRAVWIARE